MQVSLGERQSFDALLECRRRRQSVDQLHGALMERAAGLVRWLALDPAVGRIRGAGRGAGNLESAAVHPGDVAVAVDEEGGTVGDGAVQVVP